MSSDRGRAPRSVALGKGNALHRLKWRKRQSSIVFLRDSLAAEVLPALSGAVSRTSGFAGGRLKVGLFTSEKALSRVATALAYMALSSEEKETLAMREID